MSFMLLYIALPLPQPIDPSLPFVSTNPTMTADPGRSSLDGLWELKFGQEVEASSRWNGSSEGVGNSRADRAKKEARICPVLRFLGVQRPVGSGIFSREPFRRTAQGSQREPGGFPPGTSGTIQAASRQRGTPLPASPTASISRTAPAGLPLRPAPVPPHPRRSQ